MMRLRVDWDKPFSLRPAIFLELIFETSVLRFGSYGLNNVVLIIVYDCRDLGISTNLLL